MDIFSSFLTLHNLHPSRGKNFLSPSCLFKERWINFFCAFTHEICVKCHTSVTDNRTHNDKVRLWSLSEKNNKRSKFIFFSKIINIITTITKCYNYLEYLRSLIKDAKTNWLQHLLSINCQDEFVWSGWLDRWLLSPSPLQV